MISRDDGRFQRELITGNLDRPLGIAVDAVNRFAPQNIIRFSFMYLFVKT